MVLENLTECEQLVMKTVWDAADELGLMEITERANDRYHKAWAPQTVSTFLARLVRKGYLRHYRQGRVFLYRILIPLEEYRAQLTNDYVDFWNHGNVDEFLCALARKRPLRPDEIDKIKAFMHGVVERQEGESMKRVIETITCDRCGKEITNDPVRIVPHHVPRKSKSEEDELDEGRNELPLWIERMMQKDFCEECTAEIVEFALNGNTCDECVAELHNSVNGRIEDESDNAEEMPGLGGVHWKTALNQAEQEFEAAMNQVARISLPDVNAELCTQARERPLGPDEIKDRILTIHSAKLDRMEQDKEPDGSAAESQETVSDQLGGGEEQGRQAETKESGKQTGRKKLDQGKIMALHRAGWSNAQIAEEIGTTKGTIAVTISKLKSNGGNA